MEVACQKRLGEVGPDRESAPPAVEPLTGGAGWLTIPRRTTATSPLPRAFMICHFVMADGQPRLPQDFL